MRIELSLLSWLVAGALLAAPAIAKPAAHKAAAHKVPQAAQKPAPAPAAVSLPTLTTTGPVVAVVQQYLDARQAQDEEKMYALLSPETQAEFPGGSISQRSESLTNPDMVRNTPPDLLPIIALIADVHDKLHFKFRILGLSPDDPNVVLVRAYQTGKPLSSIKVLKIATVPDPVIPDALRLEGFKTATLADPEAMQRVNQKASQAASQKNLKLLALAIIQYAQDHNEKLPDAGQWVTEIMPYAKSDALFHDPAAPTDEKWSYAFNLALSGVAVSEVEVPAKTVLLFESTSGQKNAADEGESVPLPGRHDGGTDYAFADGHVQWQADHVTVSYSLHGN